MSWDWEPNRSTRDRWSVLALAFVDVWWMPIRRRTLAALTKHNGWDWYCPVCEDCDGCTCCPIDGKCACGIGGAK